MKGPDFFLRIFETSLFPIRKGRDDFVFFHCQCSPSTRSSLLFPHLVDRLTILLTLLKLSLGFDKSDISRSVFADSSYWELTAAVTHRSTMNLGRNQHLIQLIFATSNCSSSNEYFLKSCLLLIVPESPHQRCFVLRLHIHEMLPSFVVGSPV